MYMYLNPVIKLISADFVQTSLDKTVLGDSGLYISDSCTMKVSVFFKFEGYLISYFLYGLAKTFKCSMD